MQYIDIIIVMKNLYTSVLEPEITAEELFFQCIETKFGTPEQRCEHALLDAFELLARAAIKYGCIIEQDTLKLPAKASANAINEFMRKKMAGKPKRADHEELREVLTEDAVKALRQGIRKTGYKEKGEPVVIIYAKRGNAS